MLHICRPEFGAIVLLPGVCQLLEECPGEVANLWGNVGQTDNSTVLCSTWQPGDSTSHSSFFPVFSALFSSHFFLFLLSCVCVSLLNLSSPPSCLWWALCSLWLPSSSFSPIPLLLATLFVVLSSIFSSSCGGQRRCVKAWECVWIAERCVRMCGCVGMFGSPSRYTKLPCTRQTLRMMRMWSVQH